MRLERLLLPALLLVGSCDNSLPPSKITMDAYVEFAKTGPKPDPEDLTTPRGSYELGNFEVPYHEAIISITYMPTLPIKGSEDSLELRTEVIYGGGRWAYTEKDSKDKIDGIPEIVSNEVPPIDSWSKNFKDLTPEDRNSAIKHYSKLIRYVVDSLPKRE